MEKKDIRIQRRGILSKVIAIRELVLIVFIVILITIVSFRSPYFLTLSNFNDIMLDTAILMVVAIGQMMVILTAGIDLSVASTLAFSGMAVALTVSQYKFVHPLVALLLGIGIGFALGSFNGILVSKLGIPPIIATIATMTVYRGFTFVIAKGAWVDAHEMPESFKQIARGSILKIPNLVMMVLVVSLLFYYFLEHTRTGRKIYAVGSNPNAARFVGIGLDKIRFLVYMLSGSLSGGVGVLWVSRYASAQSNSAVGFELITVAACVIGGVFIFGGSGTILGVLLGSLLLGIIVNALSLVRVNPFWKLAIQGLIILFAVVTDAIMSKRIVRRLEV